MVYVGTQIVLWIVIATLFGFAIGWLARGRLGMRSSSKRRFQILSVARSITLHGMSIQQLPALVGEFRDMAKEYLIQETVLPAKQLGHLAGFSLGAAAAWIAAIILLAVASLRAIIDALPSSPYWEALGYFITVIALLVLAAIIYSLGPRPQEDST